MGPGMGLISRVDVKRYRALYWSSESTMTPPLTAEAKLRQICASIPATRPFFSIYLPQFFGTMSSGRSLDYSHHPQEQRTAAGFRSDEEELIDYKNALSIPRRKAPSASSTITTIHSERNSKMSELSKQVIKVTRVVEVSGK